MSDILPHLMAGFSRRVSGAQFEFDSGGHLQMVANGRHVVSLLHEPAEDRIHLFAEAGSMPFGPQHHGADERWQTSREEVDTDGFSVSLRWHEATGSLLQLASAPVEKLDDVRFSNWLESFLEDLESLGPLIAAGPDVENPEVIEMSEVNLALMA